MKLKQALEIIGNLSAPSKMPCHGWSIPASLCKTGGKLRKVKGSVCSKCYALRGNYTFPKIQEALNRRLKNFENPLWIEAMVEAIQASESSGFFRWFDSGDLQSVSMLERIVEVCEKLPNVRFWLPTREYAIVAEYVRKHGVFPSNLTVRLSAYMMEGQPPATLARKLGVFTSGVSKNGFTCPASAQGNKCLTCRACWDQSVENVNYKRH